MCRRSVLGLVVLQVAAIVVVGVATVARFHIFAGIDEEAHIAYVQEIAEHGRLPWLGRSAMPQQLLVMDHAPPRSVGDPRRLGFAGLSWEAFQPPLYYLVAVPAFLAAGSFRAKVFWLLTFDLLLLLAGARELIRPPRTAGARCTAWRISAPRVRRRAARLASTSLRRYGQMRRLRPSAQCA